MIIAAMLPAPVLGLTITIDLTNILQVLAAVAFIVVMAAVSGRLLGLRVSRLRAGISATIGIIVGAAGAEAVVRHGPRLIQWSLIVLFGVLATMVLLIVPEALARASRRAPGRRSKRPLLHPLRWIGQKLAPVSRSWEVLRYARQRGLARPQFLSAGGVTTAEFGLRLRLTLEDAGGMFVKFGQIASTRGDLISEPVVEELSKLRSSVRPIPPEQLRPLVVAELGRPVEEVFAEFNWEPLAAASIGQTHRAQLVTGEPVVVKIQRPGLDELLERDGTVLRMAARTAERRIADAARLGLRDLAEDLIVGMQRELDYLREGTMADRLRGAVAPPDGAESAIRVPLIYHEVSTDRLLVMEEAAGRPIDDAGAVAESGAPPNYLAAALLSSFLGQILQGGVFHADPHPGNIMVDRWGRLWLLDFGAVGLLDAVARRALQEMALGMSINEPLIVARAVRHLSGGDATADLQSLEADVGLLMVESDASGGFDPSLISNVLSIMSTHGLKVPSSMSQLGRALLTLDGTLKVIDPSFSLATEATAAVRSLAPSDSEAAGELFQQELKRALPTLRGLPDHLDELATQLRGGRLRVNVDRFSGRDEEVVSGWIDRVLTAVVGSLGLLAAGALLIAAEVSRSRDVRLTLQAIGFIGLVFAAVLVMRSVAHILRRERSNLRE